MRSSPRRFLFVVGLLLSFTLVAAACGSDDDTTSSDSSGSGGGASVTLNGGGSSLQDTLEGALIEAYKDKNSNVTVNYAKSSSGDGIGALATDQLQFAGTDRAVKDTDPLKGDFLYFPIAAAPITVSFKLDGVTDLKLSGPTIAGLFAGKITNWSDAKVTADNGTAIASTPVKICRRSKDSGTTNNFTTFLEKSAPDVWDLDVGGTVSNWPANSEGGEGNGDVADCVAGTNGAVGYVDVADAIKADLTYTLVKNKAGNFVKADLDGTKSALAGAPLDDKLLYDPIYGDGADAYPITSPTWILVKTDQPSKDIGDAVKAYLDFVLTDGQALAAGSGYAAVTEDAATKAIAQLDSLVIPAS